MRKKFSLVLVCVLLVSLFCVVNVSAADVSNLSEISGSGTYRLTADTTGGVSFSSGDIILDLNGFTVTGQITVAGANLTIQDSSSDQSGKVICPADDSNDTLNVTAGSLTVESGNIEAAHSGNDAIWVEGNAVVVVNGGNVTGANCGIQNRKGTVTVNGGRIASAHVALKVSGKGTDAMFITINGGKFISGAFATPDDKGVAKGICYNVNEPENTEGYKLGEGVKLSDDGAGTYTASKETAPKPDDNKPDDSKPTDTNPPKTGDAEIVVAALATIIFAGMGLLLVKRRLCR